MALTLLSSTSCIYDSIPIRIVSPSKYASELYKELQIGSHTCYLKGILTLDELFRNYWNNLSIVDGGAKYIFDLAAREYLQTYYPEELI